MPAFTTFLTDLFESGHARVPLIAHTEADFRSARAQELLWERAQVTRLSAPHNTPEVDLEAALEAAHWMFLACQLYVDRSQSTDHLMQVLDESQLVQGRPSVVYSVDLCLSFLPDLARHAHQHAHKDPLVVTLKRLACAWPLSSVGIPDLDISSETLNPWFDKDRSLQQLYLDRILSADDASRLQDERVTRRIRDAVGMYQDELVPEAVRSALLERSRTSDNLRQTIL